MIMDLFNNNFEDTNPEGSWLSIDVVVINSLEYSCVYSYGYSSVRLWRIEWRWLSGDYDGALIGLDNMNGRSLCEV